MSSGEPDDLIEAMAVGMLRSPYWRRLHRRYWRKRIAVWLLAAVFWAMFGWCAHAMVTQWVADLGADEGDDGAQVVEVLRG